jgi:hypothetical protein
MLNERYQSILQDKPWTQEALPPFLPQGQEGSKQNVVDSEEVLYGAYHALDD